MFFYSVKDLLFFPILIIQFLFLCLNFEVKKKKKIIIMEFPTFEIYFFYLMVIFLINNVFPLVNILVHSLVFVPKLQIPISIVDFCIESFN